MFFDKMANLWSVNNIVPESADVIVLFTFAVNEEGLTKASLATLSKAQDLSKKYPNALVVCSWFAFNSNPDLEKDIKRRYFGERFVDAGPVKNTVHETTAALEALPKNFSPKSVVFVTDQWHSRSLLDSVKRIWQKKFPCLKIVIVAISSRAMISSDGPIMALSSYGKWVLVNVLRYLFMAYIPGSYNFMLHSNLHQPVSRGGC